MGNFEGHPEFTEIPGKDPDRLPLPVFILEEPREATALERRTSETTQRAISLVKEVDNHLEPLNPFIYPYEEN